MKFYEHRSKSKMIYIKIIHLLIRKIVGGEDIMFNDKVLRKKPRLKRKILTAIMAKKSLLVFTLLGSLMPHECYAALFVGKQQI